MTIGVIFLDDGIYSIVGIKKGIIPRVWHGPVWSLSDNELMAVSVPQVLWVTDFTVHEDGGKQELHL